MGVFHRNIVIAFTGIAYEMLKKFRIYKYLNDHATFLNTFIAYILNKTLIDNAFGFEKLEISTLLLA